MVSERLSELAQLTGMQPAAPQTDWQSIQSALGFAVPPDYTELIDNFGAGMFNYYLYVFGPDERTPVSLRNDGLYWDEEFKSKWALHPENVPPPLQGRDVTVIHWGETEDTVHLFWIAEAGTPPAQWQVAAYTGEGRKWEFFEQSSVEVLLSYFRRDLASSLLPLFDEGDQIAFTPFT